MKKITLLSALIIASLTGCPNRQAKDATAAQQEKVDTTKLKSGDVYYQCEMDPQILSSKADTCSKCGMDLVKMIKK